MLREKDIKHFLAICLGLRVILTLLFRISEFSSVVGELEPYNKHVSFEESCITVNTGVIESIGIFLSIQILLHKNFVDVVLFKFSQQCFYMKLVKISKNTVMYTIRVNIENNFYLSLLLCIFFCIN